MISLLLVSLLCFISDIVLLSSKVYLYEPSEIFQSSRSLYKLMLPEYIHILH